MKALDIAETLKALYKPDSYTETLYILKEY